MISQRYEKTDGRKRHLLHGCGISEGVKIHGSFCGSGRNPNGAATIPSLSGLVESARTLPKVISDL